MMIFVSRLGQRAADEPVVGREPPTQDATDRKVSQWALRWPHRSVSHYCHYLFSTFLLDLCLLSLLHLKLHSLAYCYIFFIGKSVVLHPFEGPELRSYSWEDREEKKIAQHPAEFEPTTSLLRGVHSKTAVVQLLRIFSVLTLIELLNNWQERESNPGTLTRELSTMTLISDAMIKIGRKEGIESLWSGTSSSLVLVTNHINFL